MAETADHSEHPNPPRNERFRHLPEPIRLADMTTSQPASEATDPEMGRDPNRDFMLRYA